MVVNHIDSITLTLSDNRSNIEVLVQLIRILKMQLVIFFFGGTLYTLILVFLDKMYPSDKHKDIQ